jgi:hypothetical protein
MSDTIEAQNGIRQFDFSVDLLNSILWEYNNSETLNALISAKQTWYNNEQAGFWESWITDVFDLRTCNTFGLIVWAIILGIPITYILPAQTTPPTNPFGFGPDTIGGTPNGNGNFFASNFFGSGQTQTFILSEDQQRILLQMRYRQLVARGTVPEVNKIFADLLVPDYGQLYVIDNYNMTMSIVAPNGFPSFLSFLFTQFDIVPRPAGVKLLLVNASYQAFGFGPDSGTGSNGNLNFYYSNFTINSL